MRIIGIDFGEKRIGVAAADGRTRIAIPLTTVDAGVDPVEAIVRIAADERADELVIGLPLSLTGAEGPQAQVIRAAVAALETRLAIPIHLQDERLTTRQASHSTGRLQKKKRPAGRGRLEKQDNRDAVAAAILLQAYIDGQRPYE